MDFFCLSYYIEPFTGIPFEDAIEYYLAAILQRLKNFR